MTRGTSEPTWVRVSAWRGSSGVEMLKGEKPKKNMTHLMVYCTLRFVGSKCCGYFYRYCRTLIYFTVEFVENCFKSVQILLSYFKRKANSNN